MTIMVKDRKLLKVTLRILLIIGCIAVFFYISQGLIRDFFERTVIVTESDDHIGDNPVLNPQIMICSRDPFSNPKMPMFSREEYMENTVNVTESILAAGAIMNIDLLQNFLSVKVSLCWYACQL